MLIIESLRIVHSHQLTGSRLRVPRPGDPIYPRENRCGWMTYRESIGGRPCTPLECPPGIVMSPGSWLKDPAHELYVCWHCSPTPWLHAHGTDNWVDSSGGPFEVLALARVVPLLRLEPVTFQLWGEYGARADGAVNVTLDRPAFQEV
jgi:hypothetical protein